MNKKKFVEVELLVVSFAEDEVLTVSKSDFDGEYNDNGFEEW